MKTEKKQIEIKILQKKLNWIEHQLNSIDFIESSKEQSDLLLRIRDEILSDLLFYEIQEQFKIIESQNQ